MKTVSVLSVDIASATRGLLVDEVAGLLRGGESRVVAKVPSEFLVRSLRDEAFGAYLRASDLNVADGIGVLWAARFLTLKTPRVQVLRQLVIVCQAAFSLSTLTLFPRFCRYPIPERIRGLDALFAMLEAAQAAEVSVYLFGARAEVNQRAREEIGAKYPRLTIAGGRDGYSGDGEELTREIDESGAALLIVALGSPKQEFWIRDHLHELKNVRVMVGEGGTLDLIAGDYPLDARLDADSVAGVAVAPLYAQEQQDRRHVAGAQGVERGTRLHLPRGEMEAPSWTGAAERAGASMNKVVVLYSGGRQWGGIETYLANLFRLYDRQEMELVLVSLGEWELTRALQLEGLSSTVRMLSGKRLRLRTVRDIRRLLTGERAAVVVSQGTVANAYARAAALVAGVPSLVVVHSDMTLDYPRAVTRWAFTLSDRALRAVTKRYITVSRCLKEQLVKSGVKSERVSVIYNGVSTTGRLPSAAHISSDGSFGRASEKPGAGEDREGGTTGLALATVGRLHPVKNFDGLIKAMRLLPASIRLSIWGDGTESANLAALVDGLGLGGRVALRGESETMGQALEGADIYVQPSKSEGCSFAVAEALLHGKPVVVTPRGGLPEQVDDRVTGLVAADCSPEALAEAILSLVRDPGLAERLGKAGREAAEERFSMENWIRETTAAFCETGRQEPRPR